MRRYHITGKVTAFLKDRRSSAHAIGSDVPYPRNPTACLGRMGELTSRLHTQPSITFSGLESTQCHFTNSFSTQMNCSSSTLSPLCPTKLRFPYRFPHLPLGLTSLAYAETLEVAFRPVPCRALSTHTWRGIQSVGPLRRHRRRSVNSPDHCKTASLARSLSKRAELLFQIVIRRSSSAAGRSFSPSASS